LWSTNGYNTRFIFTLSWLATLRYGGSALAAAMSQAELVFDYPILDLLFCVVQIDIRRLTFVKGWGLTNVYPWHLTRGKNASGSWADGGLGCSGIKRGQQRRLRQPQFTVSADGSTFTDELLHVLVGSGLGDAEPVGYLLQGRRLAAVLGAIAFDERLNLIPPLGSCAHLLSYWR
jgi:hypothetical protein